VTRDCDSANLYRVLELTMTALLSYLIPAVVLNQLKYITYFHANNSIFTKIIAPIEMKLNWPDYFAFSFSFSITCLSASSFCPASPSLPAAVKR
jgi:hypothetical protein